MNENLKHVDSYWVHLFLAHRIGFLITAFILFVYISKPQSGNLTKE